MDSITYHNPYSGQTFIGFLWLFLLRAWQLLTGQLSIDQLASDEIQIIVLAGVAVSSALVGVFLILRKMTMLANSISHTILIGIVLAFLFSLSTVDSHSHTYEAIPLNALLIASLFMGIATAFLTELLTKKANLQEDASTGLVFTTLFALGVIMLTLLTRNAHIGTEAVMGNVDALQLSDCKLVYIVLGINILCFILFFKEYKITTFDPSLARSLGISPTLFSYLLMAQVSATAISAFRAVGVLMLLAFITGPALIARLLVADLKKLLLLSASIGIVVSMAGVALSRHILTMYGTSLSTAGLTVCVLFFLYILTTLWTNRYKLIKVR